MSLMTNIEKHDFKAVDRTTNPAGHYQTKRNRKNLLDKAIIIRQDEPAAGTSDTEHNVIHFRNCCEYAVVRGT